MKAMSKTVSEAPHRRYNPLTGQWLLLSPQRTGRPWQGERADSEGGQDISYDPECYLCPGNRRVTGERNDDYQDVYVFDNDFKALIETDSRWSDNEADLFRAESASGTCRVICFSRNHNLTLAEMEVDEIRKVVEIWKVQVMELHELHNWVQIFENKGEMMGCSNPHPHGQIWASDYIPEEPAREDRSQQEYLKEHGSNLLLTYAGMEMEKEERIVSENEEWICLVPYWAVWPFETLLLPRKHTLRFSDLTGKQIAALAEIMKRLLVQYDNLFKTSFPYSMGWHGAPVDGDDNSHWQLHAHYYPPLLRSAEIRKFMVGYEMLGCPQRDILPEQAASMIRSQPTLHYRAGGK